MSAVYGPREATEADVRDAGERLNDAVAAHGAAGGGPCGTGTAVAELTGDFSAAWRSHWAADRRAAERAGIPRGPAAEAIGRCVAARRAIEIEAGS